MLNLILESDIAVKLKDLSSDIFALALFNFHKGMSGRKCWCTADESQSVAFWNLRNDENGYKSCQSSEPASFSVTLPYSPQPTFYIPANNNIVKTKEYKVSLHNNCFTVELTTLTPPSELRIRRQVPKFDALTVFHSPWYKLVTTFNQELLSWLSWSYSSSVAIEIHC